MNELLGYLICFAFGALFGFGAGIVAMVKHATKRARTPVERIRPANPKQRQEFNKKNPATWPTLKPKQVPEFRLRRDEVASNAKLPTDEELMAQQAKRARAIARKQPKEVKKREPQHRATWADLLGEPTPSQWQPIEYTPVEAHQAQLRQQLKGNKMHQAD